MTYNVFSGTLNLTQSINQSIFILVVTITFKAIFTKRTICVVFVPLSLYITPCTEVRFVTFSVTFCYINEMFNQLSFGVARIDCNSLLLITALHCMQRGPSHRNGVCPSVRLSVRLSRREL